MNDKMESGAANRSWPTLIYNPNIFLVGLIKSEINLYRYTAGHSVEIQTLDFPNMK
jgi:hypothetical protein